MIKKKQKAFLALYQPVHQRFERFCRARAFHDMPCEDLMNETLLIAFKRFQTLENKEVFLAFLIGISVRILANAKRKKRPKLLEDDQRLQQMADPKDAVEQWSDVELLHHGLAQLPDVQREALILFELTGFSIKEIMEIQKSSASAVKQRLRRARQNLIGIIKADCAFKNGI